MVEAFFAIAEHPCVVSCEVVFELCANHFVQSEQVGCGDAFAVWWVGDDDGFFCGLCEVGKVLLCDADFFAQSGCFDVGCCCGYGVSVDVVGVDVVVEVVFSGFVFVDAVEEFLVEVGPFLEGVFFAVYAWCDASCYECCFDGYGSAAAHWVDEVAFAFPSGEHDDACCEDFVEWCFYGFLSIASEMEAFSAGVE